MPDYSGFVEKSIAFINISKGIRLIDKFFENLEIYKKNRIG